MGEPTPSRAGPLKYVAIITASVYLGQGAVAPVLPQIADDFRLSVVTAGLVLSSFALARLFLNVPFGFLSDRYGRHQALALTYIFRGLGTLAMSADFSNPLTFYIVVALAMGPTFGTIGVQNVMFFEMVGPRLAGLIMGLSFLVHQVGSAGGPFLAGVYFDVYGSYDGFLQIMSLILLASAALVYIAIRSDDAPLPEPARP